MSLRRDMSASADAAFFLPAGPGHNSVSASTDYEELRNAVLADMQKKGMPAPRNVAADSF